MNPGDVLDGRYTITEPLGAGGMGEVYKATHNFLGSTRVIKIVRPQIAGNQDAQERFLREARAATKVHHPNVATLHDFAALPDGAHYMVWEYIDGENLAQRLRARGTLPTRPALRIIIQALHGLEAIHRAGIVHRDISPENLMITHAEDSIKIIDLGVAKVEDSNVAQTRTGIFVGKLRYAAPEQLGFLGEDEKIDGRTDLYALAMVLVELLTGRPPYEAKTPHEYFILHAKGLETMTSPLPTDLPGGAALQAVLDKALARDRNQRYATAREFAEALESVEKALPEQRDLPTMAVPIDGDETMRVPPTQADTLHRATVRTNAPAVEPPPVAPPPPPPIAPPPPPMGAADVTIRTPLPGPIGTATTPELESPRVAQPQPLVSSAVPAPVKRSNIPVIVVLLVVVLLGGAAVGGVYFAWPLVSGFLNKTPAATDTAAATNTAPATTSTTASSTTPPQTASSSLDVTEPVLVNDTPTLSSTQPVTATATTPPTTTTVAPVRPRVTEPPVVASNDAPPADDAIADDETPTNIDRTWRPGRPRRDQSWRLELQGTRAIALRAGGSQVELTRALRSHFPNIRFEAYAPVTVRYDPRTGAGTVAKGGRVLYRTEVNSPEEFAQELADLLE